MTGVPAPQGWTTASDGCHVAACQSPRSRWAFVHFYAHPASGKGKNALPLRVVVDSSSWQWFTDPQQLRAVAARYLEAADWLEAAQTDPELGEDQRTFDDLLQEASACT